MIREKAHVNSMTVALSSLFERKVLAEYNKAVDDALDKTDVLRTPIQRPSGNGQTKKHTVQPIQPDLRSKQEQVRHTISELSKLNVLLT